MPHQSSQNLNTMSQLSSQVTEDAMILASSKAVVKLSNESATRSTWKTPIQQHRRKGKRFRFRGFEEKAFLKQYTNWNTSVQRTRGHIFFATPFHGSNSEMRTEIFGDFSTRLTATMNLKKIRPSPLFDKNITGTSSSSIHSISPTNDY